MHTLEAALKAQNIEAGQRIVDWFIGQGAPEDVARTLAAKDYNLPDDASVEYIGKQAWLHGDVQLVNGKVYLT